MNDDVKFYSALFLAMLVFVMLANALAVKSASDDRAKRAAEDIGLSHVRVESKSYAAGMFSGCSQHDNVQFRVSGDRDGQRRWVKVCATVPFGGYTVRS